MNSQRRLKLALFGLGRLGVIRARILIAQQPRIELIAVCDPKPGADEWAAANLPPSVKFFADPEDCMRTSGAEAVLISTATATHAPLICLGLDLGLHVMCEKPISVDMIATEEVLAKANANPHLKFLVPFTRRYDDSYLAAKQLIDDGAFGEIHAVATNGLDPQDPNSFYVTFSAQSGGIFVDAGIHDIDIGRYFLNVKSGITNSKKQVNRVIAFGQQAVYPDLAKFGDCDNGWGMVEFANGKLLNVHLARTITNGYEATTRLCGTKAHTLINSDCRINAVQIRDAHGVRTITTPDAFALHAKSFINDLAEFAAAIIDDKPLSCTPDDAYEAQKIATALQYSFRNSVAVYFDDNGQPIMEIPNGKLNKDSNGVNGH